MTNTISFRNLAPEDHLRDFIDDYFEQTIGHVTQRRPVSAKIIVEKIRSSNHLHTAYVCEVVLRDPLSRNSVIARKTSSNFYQCVKATCHAIEKSIRRMTQTQSRRRHRSHDRIYRDANHEMNHGFDYPKTSEQTENRDV